MRELSERISGTGAVDKTGSWISRTVAKPSLDGLGSWFEGRITKFVAGEGDDTASAPPVAVPDASQQVGPFSHYAPVSAWSSDAGANDYGTYTPAAAAAPISSGGDYPGYAAPSSAWSSDAGANDYGTYTPAAVATPSGGDYSSYAAPTSAWSADAGNGFMPADGYAPFEGGYTPHEYVPEPEAPDEPKAPEPEPVVEEEEKPRVEAVEKPKRTSVSLP